MTKVDGIERLALSVKQMDFIALLIESESQVQTGYWRNPRQRPTAGTDQVASRFRRERQTDEVG